MAGSNLSFEKIVANPNAFSWSQVYSAGKLFAVLSLQSQEELREKDYLNVLGKEIFDTLEQEFFTLETKDLESIKQAVLTTSTKIPDDVICSFVIGAFVNAILYIYILGNGRVSLKREEKLGNLVEARDQKSGSLKVASGYLQDEDVIILQTKQFSDVISSETLYKFINGFPLSEAAENLAPLVHEKEEAGAAAIIINYKAQEEVNEKIMPEEIKERNEFEEEKEFEPQENEEKEKDADREQSPFYTPQINEGLSPFKKIAGIFSFTKNFRLPATTNLSHSRKVILTIVIIILVVFVASIIFAVQKQQNQKTESIFQSIYPKAQQKYQEGEGLVGLNQSLARDSFIQAQQILESGKVILPKNSSQEKQVLSLLDKVNSALASTSAVTQSQSNQVDPSQSPLLLAETKNSGLYFTTDNTNIYGLTSNEVFTLNKNGANKKTIIQNNNDWQTPGGLSTYYGNVYVLDKSQNQILKFVQTSSGYGKTDYFSANAPDLSKAVDIAIDSSIYILFSDGSIKKYTSGSQDSFSISGLDQPLVNPTRISTSASDSNVYILDNGNSRVVVLDKSGNFKSQYGSEIIKNAKDFDVDEQGKKIYILSNNKVYSIDLK